MTSSATLLDRATEHYAGVLHRQVVRVLTSRPLDADDVAQAVVVWFLGQPEVLMARYPDPVRLGRVAARHACISFDRRQRIQRCEGARLFVQGDGTVQPGRRTISGNTPTVDGGDELLDLMAQPTLFVDDHVVTQQFCADMLSTLQRGLSAADCELLMLVDGHGWPVNVLAARLGVARETLSRRISRIRRHVQQNRAHMALTGITTT
jgi:DNA-directed RNA polymerase specialized sigma24 family protein